MFSEGGIFPLRRRRSARTTRRAAIIMAEEPTVEPTEEATTETETPADAPVVGEKRKADDAKADDADAPADAPSGTLALNSNGASGPARDMMYTASTSNVIGAHVDRIVSKASEAVSLSSY